VAQEATRLGFDRVGFARAAEPLVRDYAAYQAFVAADMHGDMVYLADNAEERARLDGPGMLPGARSVVCLARHYHRGDAEREDPPAAQHLARYARGRDYHNFLKKRLVRLAKFVRGLGDGVQARALCDTAPVLERAWAVRAGLGFVGKNGMLIIPGEGSYCLLGEVITTLDLNAPGLGSQGQQRAALPVSKAERCGSCTLCLDECPTDAFTAPFVLDPRRCISYATIEARSPALPTVREQVGDHLFGCDVCQEVCPYNAVPYAGAETSPFTPLDRWRGVTLDTWVRLDDAAWRELSAGTPVKRATRIGMARNAVMVAAAGGGTPTERARIGEAARAHDDPDVRELAKLLDNNR